MNHVTFETAARLKEAGFPQPELNDVLGHIFYDRMERKYMAVWQDKEGGNILMQPHLHNYSDLKNPMVFAPTATDILRELGEKYRLVFVYKNWMVEREIDTRFDDKAYDYVSEVYPVKSSDNPAEACAAAWLALHEKK